MDLPYFLPKAHSVSPGLIVMAVYLLRLLPETVLLLLLVRFFVLFPVVVILVV